MPAALDRLRARLAEIQCLDAVALLLVWDQRTLMPPAGAEIRARHLALLQRLGHDRFADAETGRLLDELAGFEEAADPGSDDAALVRLARRLREKAVRVPPELGAELARVSSESMQVWLEARTSSSFELLRPALERTLELRRRYVECFEPRDEPYDVLLDDYEPETETEQVREIFDAVKPELVALTAEHRGRDGDDGFLRGTFPAERQEAVARELVELFGMRPGAWRIDPTAHPFEAAVASDDIRLTTRYPPDSLEAVFSTMHEYGHGLYDHQIPRSLGGLPTGTAASFGLHESQSRLWENLVGRSLPFWRLFYPRLRERFPEQLGGVELGRFYAAVNRVQPSLVRVDADEVTYGLHVILRFELEQELLAGRLELRDLPAAWNEGMWDYLGVEVPDDASGVLQDMHWASGMIGYFPTYLLGTIMSVQIWEKATADLGDLDGQMERGEFAPLREWLGENVHAHGRKFAPQETLRRATGSTIDPQPYLAYLRRKFGVPLTSPAA